MAATPEAMEGQDALVPRTEAPEERLDTFAGPEQILGVIPFVADVSSTPRWHHLLFTEDKILAVAAFTEPAPGDAGLFLPQHPALADRYTSVKTALGLVAIPRPLSPAHVTAIIPYAVVRRLRLTRGRPARALPEIEIRAGRRTTWWFLQKEDESADLEKACYARELLLDLLPFPLEFVGFSDAPRPPEWHLRRGVRQPLPLLLPARTRAREAGPLPDRDSERRD